MVLCYFEFYRTAIYRYIVFFTAKIHPPQVHIQTQEFISHNLCTIKKSLHKNRKDFRSIQNQRAPVDKKMRPH